MKWKSLVKFISLIGVASGGFLIAKISNQKSLNKERAALKKSIDISKEIKKENLLLKEQNAHWIIDSKRSRIYTILDKFTDKELYESFKNVGNLFLSLLEKKYINKIELNESESKFIGLFDKMISSENVDNSELKFAIEFVKQNLQKIEQK